MRLFSSHYLAIVNYGAFLMVLLNVSAHVGFKLSTNHYKSVSKAPTVADTALDPKVGEIAPPWLEDKVRVLVVLSDCSECNKRKLERLVNSDSVDLTKVKIMIGLSGKESDLRDVRSSYPMFNIGILDRGSVLDLNVAFYPRIYAFDTRGAYSYIQPPDQSFFDAHRECAHYAK